MSILNSHPVLDIFAWAVPWSHQNHLSKQEHVIFKPLHSSSFSLFAISGTISFLVTQSQNLGVIFNLLFICFYLEKILTFFQFVFSSLFQQNLLNAYYVPNTFLGTRNTAVNTMGKVMFLCSLHSSKWGWERKSQIKTFHTVLRGKAKQGRGMRECVEVS